MPRVLLRSDDGQVMLDERVSAGDFESEHFRRCLAERLWWAAVDADAALGRLPRTSDDRHDGRVRSPSGLTGRRRRGDEGGHAAPLSI